MNYIRSAKYRKLRFKIKKVLSFFNFKFISFDNSSRIILIWTLLWIISLFLPWWEINNDMIVHSFDRLMWNVWLFILFFNLLIVFILMSNNLKEQIRISIQLRIKDKYILLFSSILVTILTFVSLQFLWWIITIYESVNFLNWIKLSILSWLITFIWCFMYYKKDEKLFTSVYTTDLDEESSFSKEKNMKLPF